MYNTKLEGAADLLEDRADTKRDLDSLEKCMNRTLSKFSKDKCRCQVQYLRCANPLQHDSLLQTRVDDPDEQQNEISHITPLRQKQPIQTGLYKEECSSQIKEINSLLLFTPCENTS